MSDDLNVGDLVRCVHKWHIEKISEHRDFVLIKCRWCHSAFWELSALLEKVGSGDGNENATEK